ncbi:unnamed protein product, partial [Mesorhabditis belari]|uniref:V-type proton ATPase subunit a n=1 Tax=Mesorhabditis belari TaxID=2138241 RepID=A0AAF3FBR0_9BILA
MGSLYRSECMKLCQMIITKGSAYECVAELGKQPNVHFNDLNARKGIFQRTYVRDIRKCDELERSLRYLQKEIIEIKPIIYLSPIDVTNLDVPNHNHINQLQAILIEKEKAVRDLNENDASMRKQLNEMREFQFVLQKIEFFFQHLEEEANKSIEEAERASIGDTLSGDIPLVEVQPEFGNFINESSQDQKQTSWFICGVLPSDKKQVFERVLWRTCKRMAFVRMADIDYNFIDPNTLKPLSKAVYIVVSKGESLKQIVHKVCECFSAGEYPCPKTSKARQSALVETLTRIQDLQHIIDRTEHHKHQLLSSISGDLPEWQRQVRLHKAVYHALNNFKLDTNGFLAAECWVPERNLEAVREGLAEGVKKSGTTVAPILNVLESTRNPPTYNRVNKFTKVFQSIVDSYGVASYREVNPAPFTIITFPFLFAVMFGDFAHGLLLLLSALYFIVNEKKIAGKRINDEIFNTFFGGRYIILLMGVFSIYCGIIYNDCFGKSVTLFDSSWHSPYSTSELKELRNGRLGDERLIELDPSKAFSREHGPYPLGMDPIWNIAENKLTFFNSMKMKLSIILGVSQMTFGVFLSLLNHLSKRSITDVVTNFIPQLLFLTSIFFYLCVQIITKWIFITHEPGTVFGMEYEGGKCAPSLLIGLINMFMMKNRDIGAHSNGSTNPCYLNFWYPHQKEIERYLLLVALCCIPVMLLGKPLIHFITSKSASRRPKSNRDEEQSLLEMPKTPTTKEAPKEIKKEGHDNTDFVIHQAIHTIEFVLGCVSHTASYLRLWALSLAHAQLSEVLWHMVLINGLNASSHPILSPILAYFTFFAFAVLTFAILVLMEGLSAFLHALRLHWVEFQSKFYLGDGYQFLAFSLRESLEHISSMIIDE